MFLMILFMTLVLCVPQSICTLSIGEKIYECTFDLESPQYCGGNTKSTGGPLISSTTYTVFLPRMITDVTSITKPAANGELCVIPFRDEKDVEHYHCAFNRNDCKTTSGKFSKCAFGKYFSVRTPSPSPIGNYTANLSFPAIDLPSEGNLYLIRFYNLYICEINCESAKDEMNIRINDDAENSLLFNQYYEKDFKMKQVWTKRELTFMTWSNKINLVFDFSRTNSLSNVSYFMLDNIEIFPIKNDFSILATDNETLSESLISAINELNLADSNRTKIYECTFDSSRPALCGAKLEVSGSAEVFNFSSYNVLTEDDYQITDVSSITKLAANDQYCKIPFFYKNEIFHHCTYSSGSCVTKNGEYSRCVSGKFFYVKSSGESFYAQLSLPSIKLPDSSGHYYLIQFYNLFYCIGCDNETETNDRFLMKIIDTTNPTVNILLKEYSESDFEKKRAWIKRELLFSSTAKEMQIIFRFENSNATSNTTSYLMIDNIEVFSVDLKNLEIIHSNNTQIENRVYACKFDSTNWWDQTCGSSLKLEGNPTASISTSVFETPFEITDVTSTTMPTENGEFCEIPFEATNGSSEITISTTFQSYHCIMSDWVSSLVCRTSNGMFSACAFGKMYYFKTPITNGVYIAELIFPFIDLAQQSSEYLIRFYNMYVCDNQNGCESAQDLMSIKIGYDTEKRANLLTKEYYEKDFTPKRVWIKRELVFRARSSTKIIITFEFIRSFSFSTTSYFMLDNIEIFSIKREILPTTTVGQTTSQYITSIQTETIQKSSTESAEETEQTTTSTEMTSTINETTSEINTTSFNNFEISTDEVNQNETSTTKTKDETSKETSYSLSTSESVHQTETSFTTVPTNLTISSELWTTEETETTIKTDSSSSGTTTSNDDETSYHQSSSINSESTIPIILTSTDSTSSATSSKDQTITYELASTNSLATFSNMTIISSNSTSTGLTTDSTRKSSTSISSQQTQSTSTKPAINTTTSDKTLIYIIVGVFVFALIIVIIVCVVCIKKPKIKSKMDPDSFEM